MPALVTNTRNRNTTRRCASKPISYAEDASVAVAQRPHLSYKPMTDAQRAQLGEDEEEVLSICFPEFHCEDQRWWCLVRKRGRESDAVEEKVFVDVPDAVDKFTGNVEKGLLSFVDWMHQLRRHSLMTHALWSHIVECATVSFEDLEKLPLHTVCYVESSHDLQYRYVIVVSYQYDESQRFRATDVDNAAIYAVHNIIPLHNSIKKMTKKQVKTPTGIVAKNDLHVIVSANTPNAIADVRADYYKRLASEQRLSAQIEALSLEFEQIMFCFGAKMHASMNNRTYRITNKVLTHRERMSLNVYSHVGNQVLTKMCATATPKSSNSRYRIYKEFDYQKLTAVVGIEYMTRTVGKRKYFICGINGRYDSANVQLTLSYWLAYQDIDENGNVVGHVHSKAQANVNIS